MKKMQNLLCPMVLLLLVLLLVPTQNVNAKDKDSVFYSTIAQPNDLQNKIDTGLNPSSVDEIKNVHTSTVETHKITVEQAGWVFIQSYSKGTDSCAKISLYSNSELTCELESSPVGYLLYCYVQPGTYYYKASWYDWSFHDPFTILSYVGFMPASTRIKVSSIEYNSAMTAATVTFKYDKAYLYSFNSNNSISVQPGTSHYTDISDFWYWHKGTSSKELNTNKITITENGNYSARIVSDIDKYYCDTHFTISGLGTAPKPTTKPAPTKYKISYVLNGGKNSNKNITYYTDNKGTIKLYNPQRKNYVFKGWYTEKNYKHKVTSIKASSKKNYTLYAKWEKVKVSKVKLTKVKRASKSSMKVYFKYVSGAKSYQIQYSKNSKLKGAKTTTVKKSSVTVKSLKKGTYYVRVRAYKVDSMGRKIYGSYSSVIKVKIK